MKTSDIHIGLQQDELPRGDVLTGEVTLTVEPGDDLRGTELSVLWHTEGKGDTDVGVVHHERLDERGQRKAASQRRFPFEVKLPLLPMSYRGHLIKIIWSVRVRVHTAIGSDTIVDRNFTVT